MSFNFENLKVYQKSLDIVESIYMLTRNWSREYLFDITAQLRRAVLSIPLNIAEGSSRTKKDNRRFLDIARGSCFEAVAILSVALRMNLIDQKVRDSFYSQLTELSRMISGLKSSIK